MRQLTTKQVAVSVGVVVALSAGGLAVLAERLAGMNVRPWHFAVVVGAMFGVAYFAFLFGIERFVHNRIKALYRTVHDLKRSNPEAEEVMEGDGLSRVNAEVAEWVSERRSEIKELKEREQFRREFIGNLAHELKTPIFNIQGYVLTLLEGGLEDERVNRDFLRRANNGVERLMKIVEDLDMISKLESGTMELRATRIDLCDAVTEAIHGLERRASERGVTLRNGVVENTFVHADQSRLGQVLTNLLGNAIAYGKEGGNCTVSSFELGNQVGVEVTDDGIGISAEHVPRLFERFYRVGKSRARNEGGSGLGLAIVKHIIDAHEQTITVKSREGKGTTFTFTLARG